MRIEAYNKVNSIYQTNNVKQTKSVTKKSTYDQVEISQAGRDYQVAKNAVKNAPEIRQDRVNEIKAKLASGTYDVSLKEVADKIVDTYFDQTV